MAGARGLVDNLSRSLIQGA
uniref:Uncharacterized protein n=1 Tax=Arundo donax TaxID=35708 RepID=A0A0A9A647_ARUDO